MLRATTRMHSPRRCQERLLLEAASSHLLSGCVTRKHDRHMRPVRKRKRDLMRCKFMAEQRNMGQGDRESKIFQQIDGMHEELRRYRAENLGVSIPMPKFRTGQSVLQWWAGWMKGAEVTPSTYNRTNRPAWFSAEVCSYKTYETIRYAGQEITGNTYNVYCWNGQHEVIPESFLMARPADASSNHSAGRLTKQPVDPAFWEPFNTRLVGRARQ